MKDSTFTIDPESHYHATQAGTEFEGLEECEMDIRNIGWTLGNDCPYRCTHCYSMSARRKGLNFEKWMIDKIVKELTELGIETVNLGGNEPLFTNGPNPRDTLLPYIIEKLVENQIDVGLTTSGITLIHLERDHRETFRLLNDIDISIDSPFPEEHNKNRGASLFDMAVRSLEICQEYQIDHTIITCAMNWNFSDTHIDELLKLAQIHEANIRINPLKPVEPQHMDSSLTSEDFYRGFSRLVNATEQIDLGEPLLAAVTGFPGKGCPCGRTSFRIHSITPEGRIPVSPCVYVHDYKVGDLLRDSIWDIVYSEPFRSFRRRNQNPGEVEGCRDCSFIETCRGGCAARSYFHHLHGHGHRTLAVKDPYCLIEQPDGTKDLFPTVKKVKEDVKLVHRDYLCTWIGKPKSGNDDGD